MSELKYVGKNLPQDMAVSKASGKCRYSGDIQTVGMLHMRLKRSDIAHAIIKSIDISKALKAPGVRAVYTYENTPDTLYDRGAVERWENVPNQERLFDRHIRFYGDRIAAVVAESVKQAEDAIKLIEVEYEPLPALISVGAAMSSGATQIYDTGNVYPSESYDIGDFEGLQAAYTDTTTSSIGRMTHLNMEPEAVFASYNPETESLTVKCGTQAVWGVRTNCAKITGLPYSKVRAVQMPMGGSFGVRQEWIFEPVVAYAAWDLKADVSLVLTREEQIVNTMMKHSLSASVTTKMAEDGRLLGLSVSVELDAGAAVTVSESYVSTIGAKLGKVYAIDNVHFEGKAVVTNTPVNGSFRSWGSCECALLLENHMNELCRKYGFDPFEFRKKNVHGLYDLERVNNISTEKANFIKCLELGRESFGWDKKQAEIADFNAHSERYKRGIGIGLASHTTSFVPYRVDVAIAEIRIEQDGSVTLKAAVHDHGCGTVLAMKKICAEVLDIDPAKIFMHQADTQESHYDYGCFASRTIYSLGGAVKQCAEMLKARCFELAAEVLYTKPAYLEYSEGVFTDAMFGNTADFKDIVEHSIKDLGHELSICITKNANKNPGVPALHLSEVMVDTYTGKVEFKKCMSVHDVGKAINPDLCRGQIASGIQQGIGMAVREENLIDPISGQTLNDNLDHYSNLNAFNFPEFEAVLIEDDEPSGPFGAKSIGEVCLAPVAPAVVSAINNALGTELKNLPLTPAKILAALENK